MTRYDLQERIASGGMGEVWRATYSVLGREVAVKVLKAEYADDPTFRSRFETEARNTASLAHPNIASVYDFGELPDDGDGRGRPYLVMELVRGQPLSALLRGGERMPPETASELVAQAADGLAYAHGRGIVHRDVKPANLLVTPDRQVKVTDFGIARAADAVALTRTGQVIGTPQYLSPEQAQGLPATAASDTYSLGVVLYECLAGHRPFDHDSSVATALAHLRDAPPPLPDDVPEQLRRVVDRSLAKDPEARFTSAGDLSSALRGGALPAAVGAAATGEQPTVVDGAVPGAAGAVAAGAAAGHDDGTRMMSGVPPRDPDDDRRRRRGLPPWLPWVLAAVALLLALGAVALLSQQSPDQPSTGGTPSQQSTPDQGNPTTPPPKKKPSPSATPDDRVEVRRSDYVGRPKDEAESDLKDLGLDVEEQEVPNPGDQEKDIVADVSPTGRVEPGSTITLSVFGDPEKASPTDNSGPGNGNGNGNGQGKGDD